LTPFLCQAEQRARARLATADVTRVIYMAFLAPDLVEKIVRGEQPLGLTAKRLLAAAPLLLAWTQQRALLGFTR
jgi:hypothetical protein